MDTAKLMPPRRYVRSALLANFHARVDRKANPLASQIHAVLSRVVRHELAHARLPKVRKDESKDPHVLELQRLILAYGVRQAIEGRNDAFRVVGRATSSRMPPLSDWQGLFDSSEEKAESIVEETRAGVQSAIKQTVDEARDDQFTPSDAEIARRIRDRLNKGDTMSFERAQRIARTEMAVADNTGTMSGYKAAGVQRLEWFAYSSPTFDRRHDLMDGVKVAIGEPFVLPSGEELDHPGDPFGDPSEVINCRCSFGPAKDDDEKEDES